MGSNYLYFVYFGHFLVSNQSSLRLISCYPFLLIPVLLNENGWPIAIGAWRGDKKLNKLKVLSRNQDLTRLKNSNTTRFFLEKATISSNNICKATPAQSVNKKRRSVEATPFFKFPTNSPIPDANSESGSQKQLSVFWCWPTLMEPILICLRVAENGFD